MTSVLVVDDDQDLAEMLGIVLNGVGIEVDLVSRGDEAIDVFRNNPPDLVLLDIMMPKLSGFEVCSKLRANPATKHVLVLMVTALNEPSDFERGVAAGTDDFLTKPVNKVELLCRIRSLLRVRHLESQLERTLAYLADLESTARPQ